MQVKQQVVEERQGGAGTASPLVVLLPGGVIQPGTAVSAGADLPLLLALAALATADTAAWAAVDVPELGALAAAQAGLDLATGLVVADPGPRVAQVLGALLESVPVVLVGSAVRIPDRAVRRLRALMRRSGSVVLAQGGWPGAEVQLRVTSAGWEGVGRGHGLLRGRRVTVTAGGRGAAARPRQTELWLPGPDGLAGVVERRAEEALVAERRAGLRVVG
ncbi:hypothetical protein LXH09_27670 [Streptomyces sp. CS7]|uniref:hypothetical protein n=1 Tax=Streptomyces sp. CS-7 TaxID=2906769 RepID=UPI0021B2BEC8|nr:hypothetical protein [Streptomyces sp. CS-7]MCT6780425.1 hypothetical protein [Streptomyces sp. CS-7]